MYQVGFGINVNPDQKNQGESKPNNPSFKKYYETTLILAPKIL